jgi:hypothetical protein
MSSNCQDSTFPRRALPGKLLAIALPLLLPKISISISKTQLQPIEPQSKPLSTRGQPAFKIGDLVASDFVDDEFGEDVKVTDFGEIVGISYLPVDGCYYPRDTWVYYIYWTHSTTKSSLYPCYDGEPTDGSVLRLVKQPGGQK